jgi:hypothetical protein
MYSRGTGAPSSGPVLPRDRASRVRRGSERCLCLGDGIRTCIPKAFASMKVPRHNAIASRESSDNRDGGCKGGDNLSAMGSGSHEGQCTPSRSIGVGERSTKVAMQGIFTIFARYIQPCPAVPFVATVPVSDRKEDQCVTLTPRIWSLRLCRRCRRVVCSLSLS